MTSTHRIDGLPDLPSFTDSSTQSLRDDFRNYGLACYEAGSAAAAQAAKQVPAGFVLVPREPTDAMVDAGFNCINYGTTVQSDIERAWSSMLDAAPSAPSLAEAAVRPPMCRIAGVSEGVLRRAAIANGHGAEAAEAGQVEAAMTEDERAAVKYYAENPSMALQAWTRQMAPASPRVAPEAGMLTNVGTDKPLNTSSTFASPEIMRGALADSPQASAPQACTDERPCLPCYLDDGQCAAPQAVVGEAKPQPRWYTGEQES